MGAWCYWSADAAIFAPDQLSMTILALVVMCWGIFVVCFGVTLCRKVSFGLLFLLFMVPFPSFFLDAIIGFLQRSSAEATDVMFSLLGVPVLRQGFVFSLSNFTIHVAPACSGIRSALALFITSIVAGHFFLLSPWGKMGLVAIVIPLAIIKNAFRIVGLALLATMWIRLLLRIARCIAAEGSRSLSSLSSCFFLLPGCYADLRKRSDTSHLNDRMLS
jgi:exosortase